ncbi:MAG: hypothetical protein ABEJ98_04960 [Candidatus Nanohaloarchaea archaeon]
MSLERLEQIYNGTSRELADIEELVEEEMEDMLEELDEMEIEAEIDALEDGEFRALVEDVYSRMT